MAELVRVRVVATVNTRRFRLCGGFALPKGLLSGHRVPQSAIVPVIENKVPIVLEGKRIR